MIDTGSLPQADGRQDDLPGGRLSPRGRASRLTLVCQGATAATRLPAFPTGGEPLDDASRARLPALRTGLGPQHGILVAPSRAACETAEGLGSTSTHEPALRDCDFGRWSGRPMAAIAGEEPDLFGRWLSDPATAPPDGEALVDVFGRVRAWLDDIAATRGHRCAILSGYVTRTIVVAALDLPLAAFWRLDAAPLSVTRLTAQGNRWRLACFGSTA